MNEEKNIDAMFKAMADSTRRVIMKILQNGEKTPREILEHFNFSSPSLTHHLNALYNANLVNREKRGQFIYYSIQESSLALFMTEVKRMYGFEGVILG